MMHESIGLDLFEYLQLRLSRSGHLVPALRQALVNLGRPELVEILDLVQKDVNESRIAVEDSVASESEHQRLQTLCDLAHLSRLGGTKGQRVAQRIVSRMAGGPVVN